MQGHGEAEEKVGFRRRAELPGIEVRDVDNTRRVWRCFSTGFEIATPHTWRGEVLTRRQHGVVGPGTLFCVAPGEVFTTPRILEPGSGSALVIDPEVMSGYLAEHELGTEGLELRPFTEMTPTLAARLRRVLSLMTPDASALELQSSVVALIAALVPAVMGTPRTRRRPMTADRCAAARVRDCLRFDGGLHDLERLSRQSRLSRYQVLRVFKQRYGLPPHAYALRVRIGHAQRALRAGSSPADVAVEQGFVDQSHLSRHFKQIVGVTPAAYARAEGWGRWATGAAAS